MDRQRPTLALDARVLLERGRLFSRAKWERARLELSRELLEFSARPQSVLRFRGADFVALGGAAGDDDDADAKAAHAYKVLLDVRAMADAHTAWRYQTAAKTSRLELYMDSEAERAQVLAFIAQPPLALPVAEAPGDWWEVPSPSTSTTAPPPPQPTSISQLIDEAFQALADAQAVLEGGSRSESSLLDALAEYSAADRGFERATQLVPDERTRQLFRERRQEIRAVIRSLESALALRREGGAASAAPPVSFSEPSVSHDPLNFPTTSAAGTPSASGHSNSEIHSASTPTASDLDKRLERLDHFIAQQEVGRAQREHKPASDDLRLRLQALRGEKPGSVSLDSLEQRFQRLRGLGNLSPSPTHESQMGSVSTDRISAVDRLIQQVHEEIALGILDDVVDEKEDDGCSSNSSSDESSDEKGQSKVG